MSKTDLTEKVLRREYLNNKKTVSAIAKEYACGARTVKSLLQKYGIEERISASAAARAATIEAHTSAVLSREFLTKRYIDDNSTLQEIADETGFCLDTVRKFVMKYDIEKSKEAIRSTYERSMVGKYGAKAPVLCDSLRTKIENTCIDKYGAKSPLESSKIREETKQTHMERYGCENPFEREDIKQGIHQHWTDLYGVENYASSEDHKNKTRATCLSRYGVTSNLMLDDTKQMIRDTCMKKYGVPYAAQVPEFKEKRRETCIDRYGFPCNLSSEESKEKSRQTSLERYGVPYPIQSAEVQDKVKKTSLERYGVEYYLAQPEVRQKALAVIIEKYGSIHEMQAQSFRERYGQNVTNSSRVHVHDVDTWADNNLFTSYIKSEFSKNDNQKISKFDVRDHFNVKMNALNTRIRETGTRDFFDTRMSEPEHYWCQWLDDNGIGYSVHDRKLLCPLEVDIVLKDKKIGLEIDPAATHNSTKPYLAYDAAVKSPTYHQDKSKGAEAKGYNLIHVFDWIDNDMIQNSILASLNKLPVVKASSLSMRVVHDQPEQKDFLEQNHMRGYVPSDVCYGLYNDRGELMAVMSFRSDASTPDENAPEGSDWEMLRFCSRLGTIVRGSAKTLFDRFVSDNAPSSMSALIDYDVTNGQLCDVLGFSFDKLMEPSYCWCLINGSETSDWTFPYEPAADDDADGRIHGYITNDDDVMEGLGYVKVYDAGTKRYTRMF